MLSLKEVGMNLVTNGSFTADTDPPPGWSSYQSAVLTTEAGGKIGNCLMVTEGGETKPYAYQDITVTAGKLYKFTCYIKAGTENQYLVSLKDMDNSVIFYTTGVQTEVAGDWSTSVIHVFQAPAGCSTVRIHLTSNSLAAEAKTIYFDEVSLHNIPPSMICMHNF